MEWQIRRPLLTPTNKQACAHNLHVWHYIVCTQLPPLHTASATYYTAKVRHLGLHLALAYMTWC